MAPLEMSVSTTSRSKYSNTDEVEENNLKNNFMKMSEALKEKMRKFLKEVEEKTNKNWKKSTNPLKKTKKKQSNR